MDVHVPRSITVALRMRDVDVLTAQQDGSASLDDTQLLLRSTFLGRVMVSQDTDMLREGARFLREGEFAGIVYGRQRGFVIGQFVESLILIAAATESHEWVGRIEYIPFP